MPITAAHRSDLDPAVEYATSPSQYRGRLSPRQERMLRYVRTNHWLVDAVLLHLDCGPWSVETERALTRRGLLGRTADRLGVYLTEAGWLWLVNNP